MHKKYSITSAFHSLPVEAFIYPATIRAKANVLLLKGLYSLHNPERVDSWERELIDMRGNTYTFICINTARLPGTDKESGESFAGKTFEEESSEISNMVSYLSENNIVAPSVPMFSIAHSFGGTLLLGTSKILEQVKGVAMIA